MKLRKPRLTPAMLTTNQRNIARIAGGGVISRGIRVALEHWLESHPQTKAAYRAGRLKHWEERK
jgi:hypothetical protein